MATTSTTFGGTSIAPITAAPIIETISASIYAFLDGLPQQTLGRLYQSPSSCLAIFRLLPMSARHLVLGLLWYDNPTKLQDISKMYTSGEAKRQLDTALAALQQLHVLSQSKQDDATTWLKVNENFRDHFRSALTGGGGNQSFGTAVEPEYDDFAVNIQVLDEYANERWETILHFMVGSELTARPGKTVLALLRSSGLMAGVTAASNSKLRITSRGFQFLLEDVNTQLWNMMLHYLTVAEEKDMDLVQVLGFLFMLGSLELGKTYSTESLTETQLRMLEDLTDYGLIYPSRNPQRFFPTRLATTLTSSAPPLVSSRREDEEKGFIVLETNYRIYAFTTNPLQIAVLNLFVTLRSRFPNLVLGMITRESIKSALSNGITADQIITYLRTHAHPQMRKQNPVLPITVMDQIRLWEREKNRIVESEGFLYEDFRSTADYELVLNYAKTLAIVIWEAPQAHQRKFFVTAEGHTLLRDFIKRRMEAR